MRTIILFMLLLLSACNDDGSFRFSDEEISVQPLNNVRPDLSFACAYENIPDASSEANILFNYARWLQKNNLLKRDSTVNAEIERLYRISSEAGSFKANMNLQNGAMRGRFKLSGREHLRLAEQLIQAEVATGYYFIAIFLQQGSAGLQADQDMALRYYRKAADMGSANAQAYVADKLAPIDLAPEVAKQMRRCAAMQGNKEGAVMLGIDLKFSKNYREALEMFHLGVAAGSSSAASRLEEAFRAPDPEEDIYYLEQSEDLERAARYDKIWRFLANYSYADPKLPDIEKIVPLPPAALPDWDGKMQWLEERLANVPPEQPSEALIEKLAKAAGLDPATGKPRPGSPALSEANFPVRTCYSGEPCPESGYWKMLMNSWTEDVRYFNEGEIMPSFEMTMTESRLWPFSDKVSLISEPIGWGLLG